uniref:Uncharacterized protein n=1 Tax=viral metagenome TaxID=1070528 RepID=A0A6M3JIC8_9ZZZZ
MRMLAKGDADNFQHDAWTHKNIHVQDMASHEREVPGQRK